MIREPYGTWLAIRPFLFSMAFLSQVGTPLEPRNLVRHFKSVLKAVGLPDTIRFHDLRHSCGTFLIAQGVHARVVMEILGHSHISLTMNTYGHVFPETQRQAIESIEALFAPQPGEAPPGDGTGQTSESLGHQSDQAADAPDLQQMVKEIEQYVMSGQSRLDVEETFSLRETRALVDLLSRMTRVVS